MLGLTEEQKRRIEENKRKALAKRAAKQPQNTQPVKSVPQYEASKFQTPKQVTFQSQGFGGYRKTTTSETQSSSSNICNKFYSNKPTQNSSIKPNIPSTPFGGSSSSGQTALLNKHGGSSHSSTSTSAKPNIFSGVKFGSTVKGKCVLISRERFEVQVGYSAPLIDVFKSMSTKLYDAVTKKWSFKLEEYETFMTAIKGLSPAVQIQALPKAVTLVFGAQLKGKYPCNEIPAADLSLVDDKLVNALLQFQREGVNFGIYKSGRVLLADDMGLGKTIQAICLACYYREEWPLLIVVPSSVRFDWAQQLRRWVPSIDPQDISVAVTGKDSCSSLVNILSYDLMARKAEELKRKHFQVVIMDECHLLKNYKTARCKAALPILQNAHRVILLSGTPALSRPSELYTQISAVSPFMFKFNDFGVRYCDGKQQPWGWDFSGSSNMGELQLLLEEKIMIRRLKKDVLTELPSKVRQMVLLDPSSVKSTKDLKKASKVMDIKGLKGMERRGALLQYFHQTGKAKIQAVRDYVLDLMESDRKFLIFAHHLEVLDAIEDAVKTKSDKGFIRIDGRTTAEQRNFYCKKFQSAEEVKVAILSITAANAGLNLAAASLVVFGELFWNPGILVQAEDRAHRIGQRDMVSVHYLVAQGTADDQVWPLVQKKMDVLNKAGLSKDDFSSADTTRVKDSKQTDLMQFFEESFMEEDEFSVTEEKTDLKHVEETAVCDKMVDGQSKSNTPVKKEKTLFTYFERSKQQNLDTICPKQTIDSSESEESAVNNDFDLLLDNYEWEDDIIEPEAKKPRL